jgi:DNA-binding transcriptional LysR family regulator
MTPTQARQVLAVAQHRSFSKAAVALGASQAAVSNAVAATEAGLGVSLFFRTTRAVTPTRAFALLRTRFERLVSASASIVEMAARLRADARQVLKVAVSPVVDASFVDPLLTAFEALGTGADVELIEMNLRELEHSLANGEVELAIAPFSGRSAFKSFLLYAEPLRVVGHGEGPAMDLTSLAGRPMILMPDACGLTRTTLRLFREERTVLTRAKTTALGYGLLERGALRGRGRAILPRSKLSAQTPSRALLTHGAESRLEVRVLQRRAEHASAPQLSLATLLRRAAAP